jgi:hypothetical protein
MPGSLPGSKADVLIRQWGGRFRKDALAGAVVAGLKERSNEIWQGTFELLQKESPEYRNSVDDEFTKESKSHCSELLRAIIAVAAGRADRSGGDPFDFVRTHAQWRARHQVPLIASLHAYRLAHKTYWAITREQLLRHPRQDEAIRSLTMLSDFWLELFDHVGAVLAEAHAVEEGLIVAQGTRTYVGLIDDLLRGHKPRGPEAERLCALCGIRPGAPMAVAVARPLRWGNGHIDLEVTLRSLVRLLEQVLPAANFGRLVDIRDGRVTAIACSDADTARGLLAALRRNGFARRAGNGLAAGVGISLDTIDIGRLPEALDEALLALDFTCAGRPLMHFSDIDLPEFLIRRADDAAYRLIPDWVRHFSPGDHDRSGELTRTIRAFADCNFNVKRTAQRLGVHTNTVYFRLNRIEKLTGVDARTYAGTSLLLTALRLSEIHGTAGRVRVTAAL